MDDATARVRQVIRRRLEPLSEHVRAEFTSILAAPPDMEWGSLDFEVCPFFYRTVMVAEEREVLSDKVMEDVADYGAIAREAGVTDEDFNYDEAFAEEFLGWLADCWEAAGGVSAPYPVQAFFHGYHLDRFSLKQRLWSRLDG
jgi:hypothetical protein